MPVVVILVAMTITVNRRLVQAAPPPVAIFKLIFIILRENIFTYVGSYNLGFIRGTYQLLVHKRRNFNEKTVDAKKAPQFFS